LICTDGNNNNSVLEDFARLFHRFLKVTEYPSAHFHDLTFVVLNIIPRKLK